MSIWIEAFWCISATSCAMGTIFSLVWFKWCIDAGDDLIYRKHWYIILDIDILYRIVKKYQSFLYMVIIKNILIYRNIFDNIAILYTNFSLHCLAEKKDYKWVELTESYFNYSQNKISSRGIFLLSKWSILPSSMFTSCSYACIRFTYLLFQNINIDIAIFCEVSYRYCIKFLMSSHH